ncbi:hypothetical protein AVEN_169074-1 [Araneus ventricosus]|uniref:Uncharacterized protein n=1 Tax=Araneus ventricosus TaxID=182803 RepID=A0A4Y2PQU1_ARAVE|nr:hypothetical protein AVEN_122103-1 [Araneus ventricosus]GBN83705.1 hypothetical protein AVEN_169074-1 [Araneus ventricosus]
MANDFSPTATPEQLMPPLMRSIPGGHGIQSSRMLRGAGGDDVFTSGCRGFGVSESCQFLEQGNTSRFIHHVSSALRPPARTIHGHTSRYRTYGPLMSKKTKSRSSPRRQQSLQLTECRKKTRMKIK